MFSKLLDKIKALFLNKWLKELLDKVPANGKKTYFGLLLVVVGTLFEVLSCASTGGTTCLVLEVIKGSLLSIGGFDVITDPAVLSMISGAVVSIIGLYHKLLKVLHKEEKKDKDSN